MMKIKKTAKCDRNRPEMHYLCPQAVRQRDGLEFVVCKLLHVSFNYKAMMKNTLPSRILVVGANGFTGRYLLRALAGKESCQVTGLSLHPDILPASGHYRFVEMDMTRPEALSQVFEEIRPDCVVNTAALSAPDYCELHREEADRLNVQAVAALADNCNRYGSRLIHLSTDFVFGGTSRRLYTEEDIPSPVNYYGHTKLESERVVADLCTCYAIARIVVVYGNAFPGQHGNIVQLVAGRLRKGETVKVVSDQWRTPTFVEDVAGGVERLITHPANGIYHLCGGECVSIAELAYRVADVLHLDRSLILPVTTEEMQEKTPRPCFSGLSIEKARCELGYCPHSLEEGIRKMYTSTV